jgi:hypothetical protein
LFELFISAKLSFLPARWTALVSHEYVFAVVVGIINLHVSTMRAKWKVRRANGNKTPSFGFAC